jgi:hypothetical protein
MAIAAAGAATVLDAGSATAEAAPSVNPFAGTYAGGAPGGFSSYNHFTVTISGNGRISAVSSYTTWDKINGQVDADGNYSVSVTLSVFDAYTDYRTVRYKSQGALALVGDGSGNIVGTTSTGSSFLWVRQ